MPDQPHYFTPHPYAPTPTEAIHVDPDLLESRLRLARLLANGPLTTEPGE
jgi:hypothetical protein